MAGHQETKLGNLCMLRKHVQLHGVAITRDRRRPRGVGAAIPLGGAQRQSQLRRRQMAAGRIRGEGAGEGERADRERMGPTGSDPRPRGDRRVPDPLRLELHAGGDLRRRADGDVADVCRAILQREAGESGPEGGGGNRGEAVEQSDGRRQGDGGGDGGGEDHGGGGGGGVQKQGAAVEGESAEIHRIRRVVYLCFELPDGGVERVPPAFFQVGRKRRFRLCLY
ncbi:unnamed protein product [Cuscuta epithymum]|uniref:Uncharacterized protein n=1 Tax=Cuscuta epithymum TaxID=186058 RepID=A0AAV0GEF9_9ASTE|nr:unnamed protein product [Cuscuta epithymum]